MKKKILGIMLLLVITISLTGCGNENKTSIINNKSSKNTAGNISGNLANDGLVVETDDYIYHSLFESNGIYRLDKKNESIFDSEVFIPDVYAFDLNIVGDYLYYVVYNHESTSMFEIKRTKLDGSKTETLKEKFVDDGYHLNLNVTKDYIYYCSMEENKIYKMSIDGGKSQQIGDVGAQNGMYVYDGWIYYNDGQELGKIKIDGTDKTTLFSGNVNEKSMIIDNDYVYFWPYRYNGTSSKYYKVKIDGTTETPINVIGYKNIFDDWIYYSKGYLKGIAKEKVDGSSQMDLIDKLSYDNATGGHKLFITDDWIYGYVSTGDSWAVYEVRKDGTDYQIKHCNDIDNVKCKSSD